MDLRVNRNVFVTSAALILLFVLAGALFTGPMNTATETVQAFIVTNLGWVYTLSMAFFLGFVIWMVFSGYGEIRLGKPGESPKYSYLTWFSMLFSAGIGIGLLFFGVAEPLYHFANPRFAEAGTAAAARDAVSVTFFHWGLHGWALYVIVGMSLGYYSYRHDLPLTFRSTLYPLLGDDIDGVIGDLVEVLAVWGTLFGVATSLGLGVLHVNAGLEKISWMPVVDPILLIAGITAAATISVVTGLDRGIRRLSEVNFGIGIILLLFVLVFGPTLFLIRAFVENLGHYLARLPNLTFVTGAFAENMEWQQNWTLFYWGWWIAWCPFVGMFIARISRGRTIREFIVGVMGVPCLFIFLWMGIFGNLGIYLQMEGQAQLIPVLEQQDGFFQLFYLALEELPFAGFSIMLATVSGIIYFITSSDSASLIIDMLTSGGDPDPPTSQRIFWAVIEGTVAATLLYTGGKDALQALRAASLTAALPFCFVLLVICYGLLTALRRERRGDAIAPPDR